MKNRVQNRSFLWGYFMFCTINGHFLLELTDLEFHFVIFMVWCRMFVCLVIFWTDCTFFYKWIAHLSKKEDCFSFMAIAVVFVISEMVIGFKLGILERRKHDTMKKEKMDRILKDKCCVAISLWLQDQQIWWHPQECTKSATKIGYMHSRSWRKTRIAV